MEQQWRKFAALITSVMLYFIDGFRHVGMDASMISELKALQEENRRLKKMYVEVQLQKEILQEAMLKKW